MKLPSAAQLWARERNWNKAIITGAYSNLVRIRRNLSTTSREEVDLVTITAALDMIIQRWERNNVQSKNQFLKERK